MKKNKGITLISLIITIIVMLILAVVVVYFSTGESGIMLKAQQALAQSEEKEIYEKIVGAITYNRDGLKDLKQTELNVENIFDNVTVIEETNKLDIEVIGKYGTYKYNIIQNGIGEEENLTGDAYALKIDDGAGKYALVFVRSEEVIEEGKKYIINGKEEDIISVYTEFEDREFTYMTEIDVPWQNEDNRKNITKVVFQDTIKPIATNYWFYSMSNCTSIDIKKLNTQNVTNMKYMFYGCSSLTNLDVSNFKTENVINMDLMFYRCSSLTNLDLSKWKVENVTNMDGLFGSCNSLVSVGNISGWNTKNIITMEKIFFECKALTNINLSGWDIGKVDNLESLFSYCENLKTADLSNWNTKSVTNMKSIFYGCKTLETINLSNWDLTSAENLSSMFENCIALKNADFTGWNTTNVTNMKLMFSNCQTLQTLDISEWKTSNVTNISYMFRYCSELELDCSNWKVLKVTDNTKFNYRANKVISPNWNI